MGHLGHLREEYRDLVKRLGAGTVALPEPTDEKARATWQEILEILFEPEEAAIASRLPVSPASLRSIASRLKMSPEELEPRLEKMADKGLVMDMINPENGKVRWLLAPPVVGFFEFSMMRAQDSIPKKRMAAALYSYMDGDPTFATEVFSHDTVIGRAVAHVSAISEEELPDVLDWERAEAIIDDAKKISVSMCYCRHKAEHLDKRCNFPMETCVSLNGGADFVLRRGFGRPIDKSEAHDLLVQAKGSGLVRIADNVQNRPMYLCNCCGCCCGQLQAINRYDLPAVKPSGFMPAVNDDKCSGCSRCARACPIKAIDMKPLRVQAKRKNDLRPAINEERCIGCAVCASACRKDAMKMHRRPVQPYVPKDTIERVVRMAVERGRVAHLIFDEGHGRGSKFLNGVVRALGSLPGVEQMRANEQLRSRFVRFAIDRFKRTKPDVAKAIE